VLELAYTRIQTAPALLVARLKADRTFASEAARVRAFVQSGAGCRATYFCLAKRLRPTTAVPRIALAPTAPPADVPANPDHLDQLRRRFGRLGNG